LQSDFFKGLTQQSQILLKASFTLEIPEIAICFAEIAPSTHPPPADLKICKNPLKKKSILDLGTQMI
jgi:hypothetical protein